MEEITRRLDALMGRGEYGAAESLLTDALERARREGDGSAELSVCSELLGFYRMTGRAECLDPILTRTRELLEQVRISSFSRGTILINAATALAAFGRGREALPLYTQAERCYMAVLTPRDRAFAALYNNVGGCLEGMGDFPGAEREYKRALGILENYPHKPDRPVSDVNLAQLFAARDPADPRVGECLDRAMELLDDPELLWDGYYAHTARKCAPAFEALGRADLADDLRERAAIIDEGA